MKGLYHNKSFLGAIGESTGVEAIDVNSSINRKVELRVGDVISFLKFGKTYTKVVVSDGNGSRCKYGVFGFGANTLGFEKLTRIAPCEDLTEDMFKKLQDKQGNRDLYYIKEIDIREMTLDDVERELGYKVKIKS